MPTRVHPKPHPQHFIISANIKLSVQRVVQQSKKKITVTPTYKQTSTHTHTQQLNLSYLAQRTTSLKLVKEQNFSEYTTNFT